MNSENPIGADNQQGSRNAQTQCTLLTPQRLHAELLTGCKENVEAYLQGALRDGTRSVRHNTHRFGQSDRKWLELLQTLLQGIAFRSWIYREGKSREFWVLETTAPFLDIEYDAGSLVGTVAGLEYVRGYFDAEGGMPKSESSRLYLQFTQKNRTNLDTVRQILQSWEIECGQLHVPSQKNPEYWRFFVKANSHYRFMSMVGSCHPRKHSQMKSRMKI